jgi:hypothetical protein
VIFVNISSKLAIMMMALVGSLEVAKYKDDDKLSPH